MARAKIVQNPNNWRTNILVFCLTFRGIEPTIPEAVKKLETFLKALNKQSARRGWSYTAKLWLSDRDPYTGMKVRLHFHVLLIGHPGWTVFKYINKYWFKDCGIVALDDRELENPLGYEFYCEKQCVQKWSRTIGLFRHFDATDCALALGAMQGIQPMLVGKSSGTTGIDNTSAIEDDSNLICEDTVELMPVLGWDDLYVSTGEDYDLPFDIPDTGDCDIDFDAVWEGSVTSDVDIDAIDNAEELDWLSIRTGKTPLPITEWVRETCLQMSDTPASRNQQDTVNNACHEVGIISHDCNNNTGTVGDGEAISLAVAYPWPEIAIGLIQHHHWDSPAYALIPTFTPEPVYPGFYALAGEGRAGP